MSSYGLFDSNFDKPARVWKKPEAAPASPKASNDSVAYMQGEFLGGYDDTPRKRWQKPKETSSPSSSNEQVHEEWLSSPYAGRGRPEPIKIEGANNIKNSPFFKKFEGL